MFRSLRSCPRNYGTDCLRTNHETYAYSIQEFHTRESITYPSYRDRVAQFYLNASRTRSFTFPTLILYFKFRILGHCPRDFGLDCSRYKHKTHTLHFKSFTLLKHNPTLTTRLTHIHIQSQDFEFLIHNFTKTRNLIMTLSIDNKVLVHIKLRASHPES